MTKGKKGFECAHSRLILKPEQLGWPASLSAEASIEKQPGAILVVVLLGYHQSLQTNYCASCATVATVRLYWDPSGLHILKGEHCINRYILFILISYKVVTVNVWEQLQLSLELCSILVQHSIYFNSISAKCFKLVQQLLEITHLAFDIGKLVCLIYSIRGGNTRLLPLKTKLKVPCGVSDSQYYFPFLWRRSSFDICKWHKTSC